jgi:oxygen-independent coproporphyrinogen-3 oxidase
MSAAALQSEAPAALAARAALLEGSPYQGYLYAYPHKTAYRTLAEPVDLRSLWRAEDRRALFFYLHVPFCEMRCGFCNLFTMAGADGSLTARYLDALRRQAEEVADLLGPRRFAQMAIGGGTPTFLTAMDLQALFDIAGHLLGPDSRNIPVAIETSPRTATPDRLEVLRERGVTRVSIGVETFDDEEAKHIGRPQRREQVMAALAAIADAGFPAFNIDLIYGGQGQTLASWLASVDEAVRWRPHEIYLYPLYVRVLTGLEKMDRRGAGRPLHAQWDSHRLACYRAGRDRLLDAGYEQLSMRHFRLATPTPAEDRDGDPQYSCQQDGMVGLGAGARSYTDRLHYCSRYAVGRAGILEIIAEYVATEAGAFRQAHYGIELTDDDRKRRFILKSLLHRDGLSLPHYRARFGSDANDDLGELDLLAELGLARGSGNSLQLTAAGLERSDAIGPWLVSRRVRARMERYAWR